MSRGMVRVDGAAGILGVAVAVAMVGVPLRGDSPRASATATVVGDYIAHTWAWPPRHLSFDAPSLPCPLTILWLQKARFSQGVTMGTVLLNIPAVMNRLGCGQTQECRRAIIQPT